MLHGSLFGGFVRYRISDDKIFLRYSIGWTHCIEWNLVLAHRYCVEISMKIGDPNCDASVTWTKFGFWKTAKLLLPLFPIVVFIMRYLLGDILLHIFFLFFFFSNKKNLSCARRKMLIRLIIHKLDFNELINGCRYIPG